MSARSHSAGSQTLSARLVATAAAHPGRLAVLVGNDGWTYEETYRGAIAVAERLRAAGIGPGHRIAIWMEKSQLSLRVLLGTLLAGAAYVPIDAKMPFRRAQFIATDCGVSALAVDTLRMEHLEEIRSEIPTLRLCFEEGKGALAALPPAEEEFADLLAGYPIAVDPEEPAYILYTSGSTGRPKGVVLSHRAALSFVDWCIATFEPEADDRMTSHAPFHFDLSTFDLFVTLTVGASVRLLRSTEVMLAPWLAKKVGEWGITMWYSVPSALVSMMEQGQLSAATWPSARVVLFAGEVFPTPPLRSLRRALPQARLFNLYGPTETNVCTYFEVKEIPDAQTRPIPIGIVCENLHGLILGDDGQPVERGTEGDLWIGGPNLLTRYWGDEELTRKRLLADPRPGRGDLLYNTGDRVREEEDGNLTFLGRRDHMVKVRGYRVELGEIESALHAHPAVAEAAVVALPEPDAGYRLEAYIAQRGATPGSSGVTPGDSAAPGADDAALRLHLKEYVPLYMVPEKIHILNALPRTSTGKIDRVSLTERSTNVGGP
ncbi:MAG: amino acid adenylation domain-containing protein [Candidatus Eisenbacteria bacterium]|nr:amino acid adenylation domain-containing protein [Candidatus Eisenbacteria bacterium]